MEVRCKSLHLNGGEMSQRWSLHKYLMIWILVRQDLDGGEMHISETQVGLRLCLD